MAAKFEISIYSERHVKNKHGKATREEVRDSIIIHESAEDSSNHGDKHSLLNTSLTESNGSDHSAGVLPRENDTPSPAKKRRHESGLDRNNGPDRGIFAPYR